MSLCSRGHEEVCYDGHACPACALKEEIKELLNRVAELENQLEEAE